MLFGCALSGLQEFVYDVQSDIEDRRERQTFAARRLRSRSALISLVPALVALEICRTQEARVVYLGGGKLMAQSPVDLLPELDGMLADLSAWLARSSRGALGLHWTSVQSEGIDTLLTALATAKWRAGRTQSGGWADADRLHENIVQSIGNQKWESDVGGRLGKDASIKGFDLVEGGWPIGPWTIAPTASDHPAIAFLGRATGIVDVSVPLHMPRNGEDPAILEDLAQEGDGAPYLAVLKLDGDGVGRSFADAVQREGMQGFRVLSDKFAQFFGSTVSRILEHEFPRTYLIYSGGDDLVLTGKYDGVLRAALRINEEYREARLGTLSAGVSFLQPRSPDEGVLAFRLLARPTFRNGEKESRYKGARTCLVEEEDQRAWICRKGLENGFDVLQCNLTQRVWFDSKNPEFMPNGSQKPLLATLFDGALQVMDRNRFRNAVENGIGTQKAFGFGLLSVARVK